jgi:hypothetical protein
MYIAKYKYPSALSVPILLTAVALHFIFLHWKLRFLEQMQKCATEISPFVFDVFSRNLFLKQIWVKRKFVGFQKETWIEKEEGWNCRKSTKKTPDRMQKAVCYISTKPASFYKLSLLLSSPHFFPRSTYPFCFHNNVCRACALLYIY